MRAGKAGGCGRGGWGGTVELKRTGRYCWGREGGRGERETTV